MEIARIPVPMPTLLLVHPTLVRNCIIFQSVQIKKKVLMVFLDYTDLGSVSYRTVPYNSEVNMNTKVSFFSYFIIFFLIFVTRIRKWYRTYSELEYYIFYRNTSMRVSHLKQNSRHRQFILLYWYILYVHLYQYFKKSYISHI